MSLKEALEVLTKIGHAYMGNFADHVAIQKALVVIKDLIDKETKKEIPKEP